MISNNQKKYVNSLKQKKYRQQHQSFVVEGTKMIEELINSDFEIELLFATPNWKSNYKSVILVSDKELASISSLKTPNEVLAVVKQKKAAHPEYSNTLTLALDNVQDPGNLGTIIRTADWFGISSIICSNTCVDIYNPKVIQATMGSFFRINVIYSDLSAFFSDNSDLNVYGALLNGKSIYKETLNPVGSIILMGNESKGISEEILPYVTNKISIPRIGKAESLNVATATAIICAEFKK